MRGSMLLKSVGTVLFLEEAKMVVPCRPSQDIQCDGNPAISGEVAELAIVVPLCVWGVPLVAKAQIQSQLAGRSPVVLHKERSF